MKLNRIDLDGDENPTAITVTMTAAEAAVIAQLVGRVPDEHASAVYGCLSGAFFNRFWEDGVTDAARDLGAVLP